MSDPQEGEATSAPAEGEKLSKNEIKRRLKAERRAKAKAEKQKQKQHESKPAVKNENLDEMGDLDPTDFYNYRVKLLEGEGAGAYPHKFATTMQIKEYMVKFDGLEDGSRQEDTILSLAGRVMSKRSSGVKLVFYDLVQNGSKIQVMADARLSEQDFVPLHKAIQRGDIIGVTGFPGRSKRGELSIFPKSIERLTPCLHMIPKTHFGIKEYETRYRKRYLDLLGNPEARRVFTKRSKILSFLRSYMESLDFIEVETPMLGVMASGAAARPFETLHNELNMKMYMRISPELYLKKLVVGGLDRVFEIGRVFRNEGIDMSHNPEFTLMEFYLAYADYNDLMTITEDMLSKCVAEITRSDSLVIEHHYDPFDESKTVSIDFTPPFKRIDMISELEKKAGFKVPENLDSEDIKCEELGVDCPAPRTTARLLDKMVGHFVEPELVNPTFLMNHPRVMSPLAKWHREKRDLTERFELFVNGKELCNAYTELNSPFIQRERFVEQAELKAKTNDVEAMDYDEDFCEALEWGLPPTAGWGLGVDRLCMLLTDKSTIKEVLLFPTMKEKTDE